MALSEYEFEVRQLLPLYYRFKQTEDTYDLETVEQTRMLAYNIITKSQSQVNNTNDVNTPFIFDCDIVNRDHKKILKLGIASAKDISEAKILFIYPNKMRKEVQVKTKNGVQYIPIANSNIDYELIVSVTDVAGKEGHRRTLVVNRKTP